MDFFYSFFPLPILSLVLCPQQRSVLYRFGLGIRGELPKIGASLGEEYEEGCCMYFCDPIPFVTSDTKKGVNCFENTFVNSLWIT